MTRVLQKIEEGSRRRPLFIAIILIIVTLMPTEIPMSFVLNNFMEEQNASYTGGIVLQGLVGLFIILILKKVLGFKDLGFARPGKQLWLVWPILVLTILNAWPPAGESIRIDLGRPVTLILFVLLFMSVGFYEEVLCRAGVLLLFLRKYSDTKKGIFAAVNISSLLFALPHIANFIAGRYPLSTCLTQIGFAYFFGVFFAACYLRTGSIWPVIITHALFDMAGNLPEIVIGGTLTKEVAGTNPFAALIILAACSPLMIHGYIILRKVTPEKIKDSLH